MKRSLVYFYSISHVFPFIISRSEAKSISTLFPTYFPLLFHEAKLSLFLLYFPRISLYYFTKRSEVYFYPISIVFPFIISRSEA